MRSRSDMTRGLRAVLVLLLLCIACGRARDGRVVSTPYRAVSLDGTPVSIDDLHGRVVLLNVWTLWCMPCRTELPVFERLHRAYGAAGLALVGVNVDSRVDTPAVRSFIRKTGLTYDVWLDPDDAVSSHYPTPSLPATYLIGRDGHVLWARLGAVNREDRDLATALNQALGAEPGTCRSSG